MVRPEKKAIVKEIKEKLEGSQGIVLSDYRGLNVREISDLRKKLKEKGIEYKVFKNRLARIAAREVGLEDLEEFLQGPTAFAFGYDDVVAGPKVLLDFAEDHPVLEIKGGVLEGETVDKEKVKTLAKLPSTEELLAQLLRNVQFPLQKLVQMLNAPVQGLLNSLRAIADQKK